MQKMIVKNVQNFEFFLQNSILWAKIPIKHPEKTKGRIRCDCCGIEWACSRKPA